MLFYKTKQNKKLYLSTPCPFPNLSFINCSPDLFFYISRPQLLVRSYKYVTLSIVLLPVFDSFHLAECSLESYGLGKGHSLMFHSKIIFYCFISFLPPFLPSSTHLPHLYLSRFLYACPFSFMPLFLPSFCSFLSSLTPCSSRHSLTMQLRLN